MFYVVHKTPTKVPTCDIEVEHFQFFSILISNKGKPTSQVIWMLKGIKK